MTGALQGVGAVHPGRVDQIHIDPLQPSEEHHDDEPERRPDGGDEHRVQGRGGMPEPTPCEVAQARRVEHGVEDAEEWVVDPAPQQADDDDGQDHRQEVDRSKGQAAPGATPQHHGDGEPDQDRCCGPDDRPDEVIPQG